jgi:glycosyltransferase involved in cell wall biosynthesis
MSDSTLPAVTIGLPVYNSERFIEQSLRSLLSQTYRDFVLVVSDNASTDSTGAICQRYARADPRVQYYRNETNIGNPRNFNRVFELTKTQYLKWSTADDYWAPTFLELAMERMVADPSLALCYPQAVLVDAEGRKLEDYDEVMHVIQDDPAERFKNVIDTIRLAHQHLGVIRTACLRRTQLLGSYVASDVNLLAELALYGKFAELPERLFFRRMHKDSGSWKRGDREHELRRYHAAGAPSNDFRRWRGHLGFFSAVYRSPLPVTTKLRLYQYLGRRMRWDRKDLYSELVRSLRA